MRLKNLLAENTVVWILIVSLWFLSACQQKQEVKFESIHALLTSSESIEGNQEYLNSPYVTAGDRVYMVGHQDGTFPDLGWHVSGEMGGIWNHPIKLMDGFSIQISDEVNEWCLNQAEEFVNYPYANQHIFKSSEINIEVSRMQYVPDGIQGLVIELEISNTSGTPKDLNVDFTGMVDLSPVWLSERKDIEDGKDIAQWDEQMEAFKAKDEKNDWHIVFGTNKSVSSHNLDKSECYGQRKGNGTDATLSVTSEIAARATEYILFYISGSYTSEEEAIKTYSELKASPETLFNEKQKRYTSIKSKASISIPEKETKTMYNWIKYNTDWLIRDVPEVGRGVSAGIPDYPWWFGTDNCYTLQGLLATGQHEEVLSTIDLIFSLSESVNDNSRIMHEASTNGIVFNPGNLNNTPHFAYLLWKTYEWTGRKDLLEKWYPKVQSGLEWLLTEEDKDGNLYPDGPGMMEIPGLHTEMIDVVVYTQTGFQAAANMAEQLGDSIGQLKYSKTAQKLKAKINSEWWVEEFNSYADFRATKKEALELIKAAIVRSDTINKPWAVKELEGMKSKIKNTGRNEVDGHVVHHNWVVNTPTEMGIAPKDYAEKALRTAEKYSSKYGTYVTGIDRDESRGESSKWEVFSYVGAVMTLPTGVQAISEARYGNPNKSLEYLEKLTNSFSYALPGSMYEVSPDYGMIVQAWNIYAVAVPIVEYYFGIKPKAYDKEITIEPAMPDGWDNVSLENVLIGDNEISITKETSNDGSATYTINQLKEDWDILFSFPKSLEAEVIVNEENTAHEHVGDHAYARLTGNQNVIKITYL
ncbi:MAG: glycogen debranching protein [Bacteroidota bacterium]